MTVVYLSMALIVLLATAITCIVVIGMKGHYSSKAPGVANHLAVAARHLNGDAEPPAAFLNVYEQATARRQHAHNNA